MLTPAPRTEPRENPPQLTGTLKPSSGGAPKRAGLLRGGFRALRLGMLVIVISIVLTAAAAALADLSPSLARISYIGSFVLVTAFTIARLISLYWPYRGRRVRATLMFIPGLFLMLVGVAMIPASYQSQFPESTLLGSLMQSPTAWSIDIAKEELLKLVARREAIADVLNKTRDARDSVVARIRETGGSAMADLKKHRGSEALVSEFGRLSAELRGLEEAIVKIDDAILRSRAIIRNLERSHVLGNAGMSDAEMAEISRELGRASEAEAAAFELQQVELDPASLDELLSNALKFPPRGEASPAH